MIQFIAGKLASGYEFAPRIQHVYVPLPAVNNRHEAACLERRILPRFPVGYR